MAEIAGAAGALLPAPPRIRRARGYRLYGFDGTRLLDLFQDGGRAVLGHRFPAAVTAMKAALSEGLDACLPSLYEARLLAALRRAFPSCGGFRIFAGEARAREAATLFLGTPVAPGDVYDPAVDEAPGMPARVARWRPWLPAEEAESALRADVLLPVLPVAAGEAPAAACFRAALPDGFPGSDPLPGFILAGALCGLEALATGRDDRCLEPVRRVLDGSRSWQRRGVYVRPRFDPALWPGVRARFLEAGVLLAPSFPGPGILPAECSPGEAARLAGLFLEIPGG